MPLRQLQDIVRRANRLMNNFNSDTPRPVSMHTLSEPWEGSRIILLQGTNLLVTHDSGSLICWDILTSQRVGSLAVPDLFLQTERPCMEIEGQALLGAYISGVADRLVAIYIDYSDRAHISISHVVSLPMNIMYHVRSDLFVNSRVLGFRTDSSVISWCMNASVEVREVLQEMIGPIERFSCLPFGPRLYMFSGGSFSREAAVQILPLLPASDEHPDNPPRRTINLPLPYPFASSQQEFRTLRKISGLTLQPPGLWRFCGDV